MWSFGYPQGNQKRKQQFGEEKPLSTTQQVDLIIIGNTEITYCKAAFQIRLRGRPKTTIRQENCRKS